MASHNMKLIVSSKANSTQNFYVRSIKTWNQNKIIINNDNLQKEEFIRMDGFQKCIPKIHCWECNNE